MADLVEGPPEGSFDVAAQRNLVQVLAPDQARRLLRNLGEAMEPGGTIFILGHVLEESRSSPAQAVGLNLTFLSIYDEGQAYTEGEHRLWLAEAGFSEMETHTASRRAG